MADQEGTVLTIKGYVS